VSPKWFGIGRTVGAAIWRIFFIKFKSASKKEETFTYKLSSKELGEREMFVISSEEL
jgi:hypothetical protein